MQVQIKKTHASMCVGEGARCECTGKTYACAIAYCSLAHITVCVCVCQWDTMASHHVKSPDVCMEDQSYGDKHDVCTSHGTLHVATCTCTYVQSKEDLQRTSQRETQHAWRVAKGIQFHLHNVCTCIRVL